MKRLTLTPQIESYIRRAQGGSFDANSLVVFEATAVNTLPLRKQHPIFKGARIDAASLHEMGSRLLSESVPVHLQHDSQPLPVGRVFHGEVHPLGGDDFELRTLFWIDAAEEEAVRKVENGTVDQVSVSVLHKQALNSVSGFDYFGPDSDFENIFSGNDGEGNVLGQNGVYAKLVGLDTWFEMSLVSQGGAQKARIHRREESYFGSSYEKLAASGLDPNAFVLVASIEEPKMDLSKLVEKLTAKEVEVARLSDKNEELTQEIETLKAKVAEMEPAVEEVTTLKADIAEGKITSESLALATGALQTVAKLLLTAKGKPEAEMPATVSDLKSFIEDHKTELAAQFIAGGVSRGADQTSVTEADTHPVRVGAFRINRR